MPGRIIRPGDLLDRLAWRSCEGRVAIAVNLDALIPREDFDTVSNTDDAPVQQTVSVRDLEPQGFFYNALRKPDFQRETAEWDAKRVAGLVRTFIDGDLIPAVILWKHREYLFVIDGSHRLSALIAWVHDDYGDGPASQKFFGHSLPPEQQDHADRVRALVNKEIGSYVSHVEAARNPEGYGPDIVARSRALGSRVLSLQWVRGDANKAEDSFARINQRAAQITPGELQLIRGRRFPNVMAARAIVRRGTGHQYWSSFKPEVQIELKKMAVACHNIFFEPNLSYPIKSLNLPAGGSVYASPTLRMIYDFINMSVGPFEDKADKSGQKTIEYLKRTRRVAQLMLSNEPASLALHPAVYFYSWTGKQQPILLLAMASIIVEYDRSKKLTAFISLRGRLEDFIMKHRTLLNQIVRKFGTKDSGHSHLTGFYKRVLECIASDMNNDDIVVTLTADPQYTYLQPTENPYSGVSPTRYSAQVKSGLVMTGLLEHAPRCGICGGLVPSQGISIDHRVPVSEGGESDLANLQLTHPYCNTGIKESARHRAATAA